MTNTKHTPGPWHRNIKPARKYPTIWSGRNTHVAYVEGGTLSDDEIEANINLIAAAPDLLEALESVVAYHCHHSDVGVAGQVYDKAIAAINKADPTQNARR